MSEKTIAVDPSIEVKRKIWKTILDESSRPSTRLDGEVSLVEFAELAGISPTYARKKLNALVKEGKVTKRWFSDGRYSRILVYLPVKETS